MYYGNKIFGIKNTPRERIFLYDRGNECTEITGGWQVVDSTTISKEPSFIHFKAIGKGRISTINQIDLTQYDRLFINIERVSSYTNASYRIRFYHGTAFSPSTIFLNFLNFSNAGLPEVLLPTGIEKNVEFLSKTVNDILSFNNDYGVYRIHQIWVDKYE